ncbi:MAG: acyltransferase family protein [Clostridia bacterium]|nr:acyltransferase family protein [Clostridia bacterium]
MQKNARLPYVDMAKGFAMLLVIIGHCAYSGKLLVGWLYSFHMPLFFALSGFTFRPEKYKSLREVVSAKFCQLILPYFFFCGLLWGLSLLILDGMQLEYRHINELIGIVVSKRLSKYFFSLWFLTTLFLAEPALWCLCRLTKDLTHALTVLAVGAFAVGAPLLQRVHGTYWSADLAPIALSFLILGYLLRRCMAHWAEKTASFVSLALAWGVNLLFFWLNYRQVGRSDLYYCKLGNPVYFFLSACGGTVGAIMLCQRIARCAALQYIGKHSLIFYAFESLAISLSERALRSMAGAAALEQAPFPAMIMVLIISCAILALTSQAFAIWKRRSSLQPQPVYAGQISPTI